MTFAMPVRQKGIYKPNGCLFHQFHFHFFIIIIIIFFQCLLLVFISVFYSVNWRILALPQTHRRVKDPPRVRSLTPGAHRCQQHGSFSPPHPAIYTDRAPVSTVPPFLLSPSLVRTHRLTQRCGFEANTCVSAGLNCASLWLTSFHVKAKSSTLPLSSLLVRQCFRLNQLFGVLLEPGNLL